VALAFSLPALAQKPEAQVLIASGLPGRWQVSLSLQRDESREKLLARLEALTNQLPGKVGAIETTRRPLGPVTLSTLSYVTAAPLVSPSGDMAVAPFVIALRDFDRVQVTYMTPSGFTYKGPHEFTDNGVRITVDPQPGALSFLATITNHQVEQLRLPPAPTPAPAKAPARRVDAGRILGIGLVILLAAGAAFVTFGLLNRRLTGR
jgi:hypothetical protein